MGTSHKMRRFSFFLYYVSSARKWTNCTIVPLRPSHAQRSLEEMMRVRCEWDFSRMFIVMSVKPTFTDELLKVNSTLKIIFSVIEGQCSGGQRSSK